MENNLYMPERDEYCVNVEDTTLKLLVEREIGDECYAINRLTMHSHSYCEIFVCCSGHMTINTEKGCLYLYAGDLAMIPSNIMHLRFAQDEDTVWCSLGFLCIRRSRRDCRKLYDILYGVCGRLWVLRGRDDICADIAAIAGRKFPKDSFLPAMRFGSILTDLANMPLEFCSGDICEPQNIKKDNDINRTAQLEHIINLLFMEDISAEEIADKLHVSSRHLSRIVKERYGITLRQVITDKRIATAENLLLTTGDSAENICDSVGFQSKSGFYKEFRKKNGMTPIVYRKKFAVLPPIEEGQTKE